MFSFLFRSLNFYFSKPKNRQIFGYFDGHRKVWADPQEICDALEGHPTYREDKHLLLAEQDNAEGREAWQVCMQAWRDAFKLEPYDPATQEGLTNAEINALHMTFMYYTEALKKSIESQPTPQPSTDATSIESEAETPKDTSDSGSTESAKSGEKSTNSAEEPATQ